jgi:hypothetical protein
VRACQWQGPGNRRQDRIGAGLRIENSGQAWVVNELLQVVVVGGVGVRVSGLQRSAMDGWVQVEMEIWTNA